MNVHPTLTRVSCCPLQSLGTKFNEISFDTSDEELNTNRLKTSTDFDRIHWHDASLWRKYKERRHLSNVVIAKEEQNLARLDRDELSQRLHLDHWRYSPVNPGNPFLSQWSIHSIDFIFIALWTVEIVNDIDIESNTLFTERRERWESRTVQCPSIKSKGVRDISENRRRSYWWARRWDKDRNDFCEQKWFHWDLTKHWDTELRLIQWNDWSEEETNRRDPKVKASGNSFQFFSNGKSRKRKRDQHSGRIDWFHGRVNSIVRLRLWLKEIVEEVTCSYPFSYSHRCSTLDIIETKSGNSLKMEKSSLFSEFSSERYSKRSSLFEKRASQKRWIFIG